MVRLIVLEGIDRAGKTSLRLAITQACDYQVVTIDRMGISSRVYDAYCERTGLAERAEQLRAMEEVLAREAGLAVIFVDTAPEVCYERALSACSMDEVPKWTLADLTAQRELFLEEFAATKAPMLTVKPDDRPIIEIAYECAAWIKTLPDVQPRRGAFLAPL